MSDATPVAETPAPKRRLGLLSIYAPAPPAEVPITDPDEIREQTRRWRNQILVSTMIGYAMFYFVRKNLSMAMPMMTQDLGITKTDLGLFLTLHGVIYGVSKFFNGFLGDRSNARAFMVTGLALSAIVNILFGFSSAVLTLGVLWMLNGWVQGMGFPPCARLLTHWFSPRELATKMSIWNCSHSIGAALVVVLCGYLVREEEPSTWRLAFFVPAGLALLCCVYLAAALRDTPESMGLPEPEGTHEPAKTVAGACGEAAPVFGGVLLRKVFSNPWIWIIALANFFVYTVRYAVLDWAPTMLHEAKGFELKITGYMSASFEIAGLAGMLLSGWVTDRIFGGRGSRTCIFYMGMCTLAIWLLWKLPTHSAPVTMLLLAGAGFFVYGPQCLVGIIVANLATKRAAATAVGLTGIFGYLSTVLSGWGIGRMVETSGWNAGFQTMFLCSIVGTVLFALAWPARAHGYETGGAESKPL